MATCSSQRLIGPVESEFIMNHYKAFTNATYNNELNQIDGLTDDPPPEIKTAKSDKEKSSKEPQKQSSSPSLMDKKFIPFLHNGALYFIRHEKEDASDYKGTAKPAPSQTSLNRELSTVSYTYAQLKAIFGPNTMKRLFTQAKMESDLQQGNGTNPPREDSQEWRNQLRTALETLCQVDSQTLEDQNKKLGPLLNQLADQAKNTTQPVVMVDDELDGAESSLSDLLLESNIDEFDCERIKEIQGAAFLCNRPSLVELAQSETELNKKYAELVTNQIARNSKETINEPEKVKCPSRSSPKRVATARSSSFSSEPSSGSSIAIRGAAGKTNSSEDHSTEEDDPLELLYTSDGISDSCYSYSTTNSSLDTADDPSMLYPTAATCSFSSDPSESESCQESVHTANYGWWLDGLNIPRRVNSVSTGIWLSNCTEPPSSLCSARSLSSVEIMTADLYTGDMETAEAAESEIEAANRVFDIILSAKCADVQKESGDEESDGGANVRTANSNSFENLKTKLMWGPLLDTDDTQTAVEGPIHLRTAWERTVSDNTANPMSEDCITGEEHSESFMSAASTSGCGVRYRPYNCNDLSDLREIESQSNMGATRG
uniref:SERTA domain-containing protein n=1 Tax=Haemonchus contortus TaxID=6289 RepID=A0A7I4YB76_HAECO